VPQVKGAPHTEITYRIIGAAMLVHNKLGPGHPEEVYQKALELKMPEAGLSFEAQKPVEVFLDGTAVALYYLDFLVQGQIIVEIKALSERMADKDIRQVINYFAATEYTVALWINFGRNRLEYHRLFPPTKIIGHREEGLKQ